MTYTDDIHELIGETNFDDVRQRYNEQHRYYHNWDHILHVYGLVNRLFQRIDYAGDPKKEKFIKSLSGTFSYYDVNVGMRIAAVYHDVIYDVKAAPGENELASAKLISHHLKDKVSHNAISVASMLTLMTAHHFNSEIKNYDLVSKIFLDCDIANFATDYNVFEIDNDNIVKEYSTVFPIERVIEGRKQFLKNVLNQEQIFYDCNGEWVFTSNVDAIARQNIQLILLNMDVKYGKLND